MTSALLTIISFALAVLGSIVGIFFYGWLKILKETNSLLDLQVKELRATNADLLTKHNENNAQIAKMQGQLDTLQKIPLAGIDATLKEISAFNKQLSDTNTQIVETNNKILERLNSDATTLARSNRTRAAAVRNVKATLAHI